jgi:thiol-disulfide isomerase/thioredoxin
VGPERGKAGAGKCGAGERGILLSRPVLPMDMTTGLIVVAVVLVAATAFGLLRRRTNGRVRLQPASASALTAAPVPAGQSAAAESDAAAAPGPGGLTGEQIGGPLGDRATLLQFSSAFCAPCRATRVVLADVASASDGVEHVVVDAESHLDLVRELGIMRTPTTLILDSAGRIAGRASGVPRKQQVLDVIGALDGLVR